MGCAPSSPLPEGGAPPPSTPRRSSAGAASAASASSIKSLPPPEALRDLEYATLVLLSSPELRAPLEAYLASCPALAGAAAGVAFVAALERAQGDLEQGITAPRAVENAAAPGPFELGLWALAQQALDKFRGYHQPAALELRSVEKAVFSAQNEVRLMGHAYTLGPPPAAPGEALQWVRACPIEPQEAFVHIRQARATAARLLAAYALPHFARSRWGLAQSAALRQSGYAEPRAPLSSAPPAHCPGDRVADILDALAGVAVRRASAASPSALDEDDFEAAAALRRAAWLEQFKALVDSIPVCVSVGDMRKFGAPFVHVNPAFCKLTGYTLEEVAKTGRNAVFMQGPATSLGAASFLADCLANGRLGHCKITNYKKDGTAFMNYMSLKPVFERAQGVDEQGAPKWRMAFALGVQYEVLPDDPPTKVLRLEAVLKALPSEIA